MARYFIGTFATIENYKSLKYEFGNTFKGKWVKEKDLHIALKFLGEVKNPDLVIEKLKKINYPKKQIIVFKRLKLFKKKILSLRSSNKTLYKLQNKIEESLQGDFQKEKNFKPHITIMRVKRIKDIEYKEKFKTLDTSAKIKLKMCLIESKLDKDGVRYKIVREF